MATNPAETGAESFGDGRAAKRKSLLLRSAKVICQTGEYVCTVRDVSELGTGLGFLHEVPREPRILLQLTNGVTYPIERVWQGKRQAGYRFADSIDVDEFLNEQSPFEPRAIRLSIGASARITDGKASMRVKLVDLACNGAKLESERDLPQDRLLGFEVAGMHPQLGQIRWGRDGQFGMQFQYPLSIQELAKGALNLQPFGVPLTTGLGDGLAKACAA